MMRPLDTQTTDLPLIENFQEITSMEEAKTTLPDRLRSEFLWRDVALKELAYEAADEIERLTQFVKDRQAERSPLDLGRLTLSQQIASLKDNACLVCGLYDHGGLPCPDTTPTA